MGLGSIVGYDDESESTGVVHIQQSHAACGVGDRSPCVVTSGTHPIPQQPELQYLVCAEPMLLSSIVFDIFFSRPKCPKGVVKYFIINLLLVPSQF